MLDRRNVRRWGCCSRGIQVKEEVGENLENTVLLGRERELRSNEDIERQHVMSCLKGKGKERVAWGTYLEVIVIRSS